YGDVEGFDLDLLQDVDRGRRGLPVTGSEEIEREGRGMGLPEEPLQGPVSTLLDRLDGDRRQGDDIAHVGDVARVAEVGQVMLHAVVPGNQRGGMAEAD